MHDRENIKHVLKHLSPCYKAPLRWVHGSLCHLLQRDVKRLGHQVVRSIAQCNWPEVLRRRRVLRSTSCPLGDERHEGGVKLRRRFLTTESVEVDIVRQCCACLSTRCPGTIRNAIRAWR